MKKDSRSYHKLFKATLATTIAAGAIVAVAPHSTNANVMFKDLNEEAHYYEPVLNLNARGIVKGYEDGTFKPNNSVTRGQAAKILALALGLDTVNVKNPGFTDVKVTDAYYGPIAALAQSGIINGYDDKTFKPNDKLKRSQMAKIIALGFELEEESLTDKRFTDVKSSDAYAGYVQSLLTHEITTGTTPTTFGPNALVTRGQIASFVVRSEAAVSVKAPTPGKDDGSGDGGTAPTPGKDDGSGGGGTAPTPGKDGGSGSGEAAPTPSTGNEVLNESILTQLKEANSAANDAVGISLAENTFTVDIKDATSTLESFNDAAALIFKSFKTNTIVKSATITTTFAGRNVVIADNKNENGLDLDGALEKALAKVGLPSSTNLTILKNRTITLKVTGTIDDKEFDTTYHFNFQSN